MLASTLCFNGSNWRMNIVMGNLGFLKEWHWLGTEHHSLEHNTTSSPSKEQNIWWNEMDWKRGTCQSEGCWINCWLLNSMCQSLAWGRHWTIKLWVCPGWLNFMHYYSLVILWYYWGNKVDTSRILEIQSIVRIVIMGHKLEVIILK